MKKEEHKLGWYFQKALGCTLFASEIWMLGSMSQEKIPVEFWGVVAVILLVAFRIFTLGLAMKLINED